MQIPIVFSMDNNYIMPINVAITSLLENREESTFYLIYILIGENVDTYTQNQFKSSLSNYNGFSLNYVNAIDCEKFIDLDHFSKMRNTYSEAIFYRLFLHQLLPSDIDKCIYCDGDVVINTDLSNLFSIDIEKKLFAAEHDPYIQYVDLNDGMCLQEEYINSGVLIINCKRWREEHIEEKIVPLIGRKFRFPDQDILNIIGGKRIEVLPEKEYVEDLPYEKVSSDNEIIGNSIIHFNSFLKPWNTALCHPYYELWERYAKMCGYSSIIEKNNESRGLFKKYIEANGIKKVLIWGATITSLYAAFAIESFGVEVIGFGDNNDTKREVEYYKYHVYGTEKMKELEGYHIIIVSRSVMEVAKQLNKIGVCKSKIIPWNQIWLMIWSGEYGV